MGRGTFVYLSYTALVLLASFSSANAGLWSVDIDESPAPPAALGPPFSAHASRNKALLPYQIVGVVGAYIGSALIVGTLLLTVGRSLRKKAQTMASQPKEMVKPMPKAFDASPVSPIGSWYSPKRVRGKKSATSSIRSGVSQVMSPGMDSVVSFDNTVIEADLARRQEEMEMLYAAVMAQDERKNSQQNITTTEIGGQPPEYSRQNPPRLITDDPSLRHLQPPGSYSGPISPGTPKSPIRAIYPPGSYVPFGPTSPTSPIKADIPNYSFPNQSGSDLRINREARTPSFSSAKTGVSATNTTGPNKIRKSLRNLKISGPVTRGDDNSDGARTPLSPRFYTNPGIPPEPPTSRTTESVESRGYQPTTPGTGKSWRIGDEYNEQMDQVRDLPQPNPQRLNTYHYDNQAQMVTDAASTRPDPRKPSGGVNAGTGSLPLREMNRQYAQQSLAQQQRSPAQAAFPLSPGHWNNQPVAPASAGYITSAGPVKTTFIDARRDRLHAPRTGQATPYSPYMPYTPLTPVTPRLTSRAERKQREKEEKKARGVMMEEDAVIEEGELWSSGY